MKATLVTTKSVNIKLPEEVELNIKQYYDCLITMTDLVMYLHDLGWFVVRVSDDTITLERDFGIDGYEVLLNITFEV